MRGEHSDLDDWDPPTLLEVEMVFADAPFRWWVSGGVALELYVGDSWRSHEDVDIGILRSEADRVHTWLSDWDLWVAARGELSPWAGEPLNPGNGENNVWARQADTPSWRFDLTVGSGDTDEWVYRRDPEIRRSWDAVVLQTPAGLPYLSPEVQLLFKSKNPRSKDDVDATKVIPLLTAQGRSFLAAHLDTSHAWHTLLNPG